MTPTSAAWDATTSAATSDGSAFHNVAIRASYIVIGVVGFLGNGLVVCIMLSSPVMRKATATIYLVSQSLLDFLAALFVAVTAIADASSEGLSGDADRVLCRVWLTRTPLWSFLMSSTYSLLALSVERYLRVVHPVVHRNRFTRRWVWGSIVAAWIIGPAYNLLWIAPTTDIVDGSCIMFAIWPTAAASTATGIITFLLQWLLPLVVMVYCYTRMALVIHARIKADEARKLNAQGQQPGQPQGQSGQGKDQFQQAKDNIIKTLVIVCLCFVLCWTWNSIYIFLYFVGRPTSFTSSFYHFTVIAVFANSCVNPFVYAANYSDFQKAAKALFCRQKSNVVGDISTAQGPSKLTPVQKQKF